MCQFSVVCGYPRSEMEKALIGERAKRDGPSTINRRDIRIVQRKHRLLADQVLTSGSVRPVSVSNSHIASAAC